MKKIRIALFVLTVLALAVGIGSAGDEEKPWFDLTNCSMCKNLAEEGLIEHLEWENHLIKNGLITVSRVDEEYEEAMKRAEQKMTAVAAKLQSGEQVPLCGFCMSYGKLMMAGVQMEEIESEFGHITLMTASDPELVKMIHAHGQHTIDAYEEWQEAAEAAGHSGAGD